MINELLQILNQTNFGIEGTIIGLLITIILAFIVSRDIEDIKITAFPIAVSLFTLGFNINIFILMILGIISTFKATNANVFLSKTASWTKEETQKTAKKTKTILQLPEPKGSIGQNIRERIKATGELPETAFHEITGLTTKLKNTTKKIKPKLYFNNKGKWDEYKGE